MKVVIADVRQDHLDHAMICSRGAAARAHAMRLDVADRAAMAGGGGETVRVFGKVHVLVNNAAVGLIGPMIDARYDDWDWVLGVNVGGVVNGIIEFLPKIRAHGEPGHIVATSSMADCSLMAGAGRGIYNTTKYAVVGLMESLREELEPLDIGVSVFCPGLVEHQHPRVRTPAPGALLEHWLRGACRGRGRPRGVHEDDRSFRPEWIRSKSGNVCCAGSAITTSTS